MEELMMLGLNGLRPTSPTYQTMPKNVCLSRTKINPTAMTSFTHLNLHNGALSAAPSTHTTMTAIEWLRRNELRLMTSTSTEKLEKLTTLRSRQTYSKKLSKVGEVYARCSTSLNLSPQRILAIG